MIRSVICQLCGKEFLPIGMNQKYCCNYHREIAARDRRRGIYYQDEARKRVG